MKRNIIITLIVILLLGIVGLFLITKDNNEYRDIVKYNGKTYQLLEYNMDIFTYNYNSNEYYEEDIIKPIKNNKWDMVYFNGDLFVIESEVDKVTKYYQNEKNYEWFIVYEENDKEIKIPINITKDDLKYFYNIENINKKEAIKFEDIKQFLDIVKISNDGLVMGLTNLVQFNDMVYWKTEIMNEEDKEYIIELSNSLTKKILDIIKK